MGKGIGVARLSRLEIAWLKRRIMGEKREDCFRGGQERTAVTATGAGLCGVGVQVALSLLGELDGVLSFEFG